MKIRKLSKKQIKKIEKFENRVHKGAQWLDEEHPGWEDKISIDHLDLMDGTVCILGQVMGDFFDALEEIRGRQDERWAIKHGFYYDPKCDDPDWRAHDHKVKRGYELLTQLWVNVIRCRRGEPLKAVYV